jgi:hypothetical protein
LCRQLSELEGKSHDALKWGGDSPLKKIGTFDELEPEARKIVVGTLISRPYEVLSDAFFTAALQLSRFQTGKGLTQEFARWVGEHVGRIYGAEVGEPFSESKQARGELPIKNFRYLHLIGLSASAGLWLWLLIFRRHALTPEIRLLFAFTFGALVWSAGATAALSGAYDRYFARIIWVVCFVALVGLLQVGRLRRAPFSAQVW